MDKFTAAWIVVLWLRQIVMKSVHSIYRLVNVRMDPKGYEKSAQTPSGITSEFYVSGE